VNHPSAKKESKKIWEASLEHPGLLNRAGVGRKSVFARVGAPRPIWGTIFLLEKASFQKLL